MLTKQGTTQHRRPLGIHEQLLLRRDGKVPQGAVDYIDHMPIGYRRDQLKALADTSAPGDDQA